MLDVDLDKERTALGRSPAGVPTTEPVAPREGGEGPGPASGWREPESSGAAADGDRLMREAEHITQRPPPPDLSAPAAAISPVQQPQSSQAIGGGPDEAEVWFEVTASPPSV